MNGVDAGVFTTDVGENAPEMREEICDKYLGYLGVQLDKEANKVRGKERVILHRIQGSLS